MDEILRRMVAHLNANAYIPPLEPTAQPAVRKKRCKVAKQVKLKKGAEFTFTSGGSGGSSKYPWDEWFNGDLLLLERSTGLEDEKGTITTPDEKKDYEVRTDAMPPKIKTAARRKYKVVQISRRDADGHKLVDSLIIKARDMTPEERQDEDRLRAEEKAARKAAAETNGDDGTYAAPDVQEATA